MIWVRKRVVNELFLIVCLVMVEVSSSSSEYGGGYSILGMSIEIKKSSGGQLDEGTHLNRKHQGGRHGSSESGKRQSGDGKRGTRRLKGGR